MILNVLGNEPTAISAIESARVLAVAGGPAGLFSNRGVAA
jgi:hypothetical protein